MLADSQMVASILRSKSVILYGGTRDQRTRIVREAVSLAKDVFSHHYLMEPPFKSWDDYIWRVHKEYPMYLASPVLGDDASFDQIWDMHLGWVSAFPSLLIAFGMKMENFKDDNGSTDFADFLYAYVGYQYFNNFVQEWSDFKFIISLERDPRPEYDNLLRTRSRDDGNGEVSGREISEMCVEFMEVAEL